MEKMRGKFQINNQQLNFHLSTKVIEKPVYVLFL